MKISQLRTAAAADCLFERVKKIFVTNEKKMKLCKILMSESYTDELLSSYSGCLHSGLDLPSHSVETACPGLRAVKRETDSYIPGTQSAARSTA